jgi:carbamate kinase
MLVVIALGGNALLPRGEPLSADNQRANVRLAAQAIAPVAAMHQLVIGVGNGPQAGLLAWQGAAQAGVEPSFSDVLGAQTEETAGYMIEQELGNLLPFERPFATIFTMVEVDPGDPAFENPRHFIGPVYEKREADRLTVQKDWVFKQDGQQWRRVVASPEPKRIFELHPIKWLLERNTIVIAAGGGGIPTMYRAGADRTLVGVECVVDKNFASELLARQLGADIFIMLTEADAVYLNWGGPTQTAVRRAPPAAFEGLSFASDSIGPKVKAACRFAEATGHRAAIGAVADLRRIIAGDAGTTISTREKGIVFASNSSSSHSAQV